MSDLSQSNSLFNKPPKTKQQYSRNVKKLKIKLANIQQQIDLVEKKMRSFQNTSNDKIISLKIAKFCKQRRITPEMLYRFADRPRKNTIPKSDFKQTLNNLGIKLSQHEMTRLQYLLDQDMSGQISYSQYKQYLIAFGINKQYATDQILMIDVLNKLDIGKKRDDDNSSTKKKLLNYDQFLKYCRQYYPQLKQKQIATIFNLLKKGDFIDIDDFINYINDKLKNKKKKDVPKQQISEEDPKSLKSIIKKLLKNRGKDSKAQFHTIQFAKLQGRVPLSKTQLLALFRQIDKQKRGSFGFNQLIQFYIQKQKQTERILYAYELIGKKMYAQKQIPQDVLYRYNDGPAYKKISLEQFKKFMSKQFGVGPSDTQLIFRSLQKTANEISIKRILDAMKLEQAQRKLVYIKPTAWKTQNQDFWRKNSFTILFNPLIALRFCIQIAQQMKKQRQKHGTEHQQAIFWNDFEFGPTYADPSGVDSIGLSNIETEDVKWITVEQLGMTNFYSGQNKIQSSGTLPHQKFSKSLFRMVKQNNNYLWSNQKIDYNKPKVDNNDLVKLFEGIYPKVFHEFALLGIYVLKFYSKQKWVYVLIDNKLPCNIDNKLLFSHEKGCKNSWVSLIQKAYGKLKGSYKNLFTPNSIPLYIHQLCGKLPVQQYLSKQLMEPQASPYIKNDNWNKMNKRFQQFVKDSKMYAYVSDKAASRLIQNKVETGIQKNMLYQILSLLQISDQKSQNTHKSHRLVLTKIDSIINEQQWNSSWNQLKTQVNKYDTFEQTIKQMLGGQQKLAYSIILNYKLFRNIFDRYCTIKTVQFDKMIILRKIVQFQQKHVCKYELSSKLISQNKIQPIHLIVTINRVKSPDDTQIEFCLKQKQNKQYAIKCTKSFKTCLFTINELTQTLEIKVLNWHEGQDHVYSLTFYFLNPQYHLKQLDRQILFKYVGEYSEKYYIQFDKAGDIQKKWLLSNYFKGANRSAGCCG